MGEVLRKNSRPGEGPLRVCAGAGSSGAGPARCWAGRTAWPGTALCPQRSPRPAPAGSRPAMSSKLRPTELGPRRPPPAHSSTCRPPREGAGSQDDQAARPALGRTSIRGPGASPAGLPLCKPGAAKNQGAGGSAWVRGLRAGGLHRPGAGREDVRGRGRAEVPAGRRVGSARRVVLAESTRLLQQRDTRRSFLKSPTGKATRRFLTSPGRDGSDGKEATRIFIRTSICPGQAGCLRRLEPSCAPSSYPVSRLPGPPPAQAPSCPGPGDTFLQALLRKTTSPPQNGNLPQSSLASFLAKGSRVLGDQRFTFKC